MDVILKYFLVLSKRIINLVIRKKKSDYDFISQSASNEIKNAIENGKPLMIARIGFVEMNCISGYIGSRLGINKYIKFLNDEISSYKVDDYILKTAKLNAGIFPADEKTINNFSRLMLEDIKEVDILGHLSGYEPFFIKKLNNLKSIRARDIEPYYVDEPWSKALKNKRVLVVHPFTESITKQYKNRLNLFDNPDILPEFSLITLKSVQSAAGQNNEEFADWFESLDFMKNEISKKEFDIAIIGCGAYGFPLAAHVKRMGKQAIHMGGATQILFGIKGKRWENHAVISKLFNEYWIRPNSNELPPRKDEVEDGCYW